MRVEYCIPQLSGITQQMEAKREIWLDEDRRRGGRERQEEKEKEREEH